MKKKYVIKVFSGDKVIREERKEETEEGIKGLVETLKGITGEEYQIKYYEE